MSTTYEKLATKNVEKPMPCSARTSGQQRHAAGRGGQQRGRDDQARRRPA